MKTNALNWFEIFVADFDRALNFYQTILGQTMTVVDCESKMGIFPAAEEGVAGSITLSDKRQPGEGGTLVYLNVEGDLDGVLSRVWSSGGTVVQGRMAIPPHGFIGIFKDTEGNAVGLHSMV